MTYTAITTTEDDENDDDDEVLTKWRRMIDFDRMVANAVNSSNFRKKIFEHRLSIGV